MSKESCYKIDYQNEDNNEVTLSPNEYNQILNIQQQILEKIASHKPTSEILEKLCLLAESFLPNSVASIMIKNRETASMNAKTAPSTTQKAE